MSRRPCRAEVGGEPALLGIRSPIERKRAGREDPRGRSVEPPVDQVEVVGGLVHKESAGVRLLPMPAPEVVGAMPGVQHPVEVDTRHAPDRAVRDELPQRAVPRRVAVVEGDHHRTPGRLLGLDDLPRAGGVDRERLLHDDVRARPKAARDQRGVGVVGAGDDHPVHPLVGDHPFQTAGEVRRQVVAAEALDEVQVVRQPARVGVEQGDKLGRIGVIAEDRPHVLPGSTPGTHYGITGRHRPPSSSNRNRNLLV